jgi:hypothetical protein
MKRPQNYATIRIDEKLRERIKALAENEHRSFMGQVVVLLEEALAQRGKRSGALPASGKRGAIG